MTDAELLKHKADILKYGVMKPADFNATNTSLQWAFYTATQRMPGFDWEGFSASIVRMSWKSDDALKSDDSAVTRTRQNPEHLRGR